MVWQAWLFALNVWAQLHKGGRYDTWQRESQSTGRLRVFGSSLTYKVCLYRLASPHLIMGTKLHIAQTKASHAERYLLQLTQRPQ
jgi:hypothetical protein